MSADISTRGDRHRASTQRDRIPTGEIGRLVMEALKSLDDVAYVRFASVYRNFREAKFPRGARRAED